MTWVTPRVWVAGERVTATKMNEISTNFSALYPYTTAGDLAYRSAVGDYLDRVGIGSSYQQLVVVGGVPAWVEGVPGIFQAAGDIPYGSAADTVARLAKPSSASGVLKETSSGVPSWRDIKLTVQLQIVADGLDVDTASLGYFFIPSTMDGMNLVRATAYVETAGTTNATTVQVRNMTKYSSNDALSTAISIASGGTSATAGTVNTSYDDVSTNDKIKVYVTGASTTKPKGLYVVLEYQLP